MGIRNLFSFMMKNNCCWKQLSLRQPGSKIVIDGCGLCYRLHHESELESGEYCQFYRKVVDYLSFLTNEGLEVYVVIDGVDYDNKKVVAHRSRSVQCLKRLWDVNSKLEKLTSPSEITISYMARKVFIDAVRDSSVKYFVADGEGDRDVVSLANYFGCPVFGSDSDFFIFNIEGGYIPMNDGSGRLVDLNGEVQCFLYRQFDAVNNLRGLYPRLPIAYCVGNDFHGSNALPELGIEKRASIETVISKCCGKEFDHLQKKISSDYTFYHVEACAFDHLCQSMFLLKFKPSIPKWVVADFKKGLFSSVSMFLLTSTTWHFTLAIEDLCKNSASRVMDNILPYIVGAVLSCEKGTREFTRVRRKDLSYHLKEETVRLSEECMTILGSHNLENISDLSLVERNVIFLRVFCCTSEMLQNVPDDLKLAVIASRYWLRSIVEDIDCRFNAFIVALVFCLQKCLRGSPDKISLPPNQMGRLRRIHYLAQWEYMFHLALVFNQILGSPFIYTSLGQLFSKSVFNGFFKSKPEDLLSKLDTEGQIVYEAITKNVLPNEPVQQVAATLVTTLPTISTQK